jgi:hypothetical protein
MPKIGTRHSRIARHNYDPDTGAVTYTQYQPFARTTERSFEPEESATVRMRYNPDVYAALRDSECVVVKGGGEAAGVIVGGKPDRSRADLWSLWGGVDNVREDSREMEFKVRRYEPK